MSDSHPGILDRDFAIEAGRPNTELCAGLLRDLVDHGTMALVRCDQSATGGEGVDLAPLSIYRHVLEMTDGIETLVAHSAPASAVPCLRSSFEAWLYLQYLFEIPGLYSQRSCAFTAVYALRRMEAFRKLDPKTDVGREARRDMDVDVAGRRIRHPDPSALADAIANMHSLLAESPFVAARDEYARVSAATKKRLPWYALFSGPRNLAELARHLNRPATYTWLYGHWSSVGHGTDLARFWMKTPSGKPAIRPLRDLDSLREVTGMAVHFVFDSTRRMLAHFRGGEEESLSRWYVESIRDRYRAIAGLNEPS